MLLRSLQALSPETAELDESVAGLAIAKLMEAEYTELAVPAPEWIRAKRDELEREVKRRHRDYLERALAQAKSRKEALKSREQRVQDTDAEIARLEAALSK